MVVMNALPHIDMGLAFDVTGRSVDFVIPRRKERIDGQLERLSYGLLCFSLS